MNSSRKTLEGGFACLKCCWYATKRSHFCFGLLLVMKNGSITTTPIAKNHVKPGHPAKSAAKPNIHGAKVMLCIWWDQKGVLYYELQKPGETINGERYRTQFSSEQGIKNWLDSFLAAKPAQVFCDGIHKSPERWEKVIASVGQYFE